jgi:PIN domain nuclease of toxin-antitoxin system
VSELYILDACAVIASLKNEPGAEVVSAILRSAVDTVEQAETIKFQWIR